MAQGVRGPWKGFGAKAGFRTLGAGSASPGRTPLAPDEWELLVLVTSQPSHRRAASVCWLCPRRVAGTGCVSPAPCGVPASSPCDAPGASSLRGPHRDSPPLRPGLLCISSTLSLVRHPLTTREQEFPRAPKPSALTAGGSRVAGPCSLRTAGTVLSSMSIVRKPRLLTMGQQPGVETRVPAHGWASPELSFQLLGPSVPSVVTRGGPWVTPPFLPPPLLPPAQFGRPRSTCPVAHAQAWPNFSCRGAFRLGAAGTQLVPSWNPPLAAKCPSCS